jgi:hypothetical protein
MSSLATAEIRWHEFQAALIAAMKRISPAYFSVPRITGDVTWSERPYCYELYHQLRCLLGDDYPYTIHGELDKNHRQLMRRIFRGTTPDFVVHNPGTMDNFVVVEVKSTENRPERIWGDIVKLQTLTKEPRYQHGILIVFGPNNAWSQGLDVTADPVSLLWHKTVGSAPLALNNPSGWQSLLAVREQDTPPNAPQLGIRS